MSKIKVLSGLVSGQASSWLQMAPFSLCPHMASPLHIVRAVSGAPLSSYKVVSPIGSWPLPRTSVSLNNLQIQPHKG